MEETTRKVEVIMRYWSGNVSRYTLQVMEEYLQGESLPEMSQNLGLYIYQLHEQVRRKMHRARVE